MKNTQWIFIIFLAIGLAETANILILLPLPLYSHTNTFLPIFKELSTRGHNITMVSPYPQKQIIPNWTDITIDISIFKQFMDETVKEFMNHNVYVFYFAFWKFCSEAMKLAYEDKTLQKLISSEDLNYDLLILEPFFAQESLIAFGHKIDVPVIGLHPISLSPWPAYLSGNEFSFSFSPNFRTSYTSHMTLTQRLDNTLINLIEFFTAYFLYLPQQEKLMEDFMVYPGYKSRPPILAMLKNVSLTLIDYHHSVGYVNPLQPNTIPVGGLSLKHAVQLPEDLKDILEGSKTTVIYLSFGSHVSEGDVSTKLLKALLEAFEEIDETVLMKWDIVSISNKPKNVEIRKWFPQPSVLAHPKVKLFISHGGLHGITEASSYGVPILGIPFFSDQEFNMRFVEQVGAGLTLLQRDVSKQSLLDAIHKLLNNTRHTALQRSRIVSDRPHSALESSVYWIEYVLRHKGAKHLRPARLDLSIYQLFLLDVMLLFLFLAVMMAFLLIVSIKCLRRIIRIMKNKIKKEI